MLSGPSEDSGSPFECVFSDGGDVLGVANLCAAHWDVVASSTAKYGDVRLQQCAMEIPNDVVFDLPILSSTGPSSIL